jgi:hypothetical protein
MGDEKKVVIPAKAGIHINSFGFFFAKKFFRLETSAALTARLTSHVDPRLRGDDIG